jgi:alpha-glucosidase
LPWTTAPAGSHGFSAGADVAPPWLPQPTGWGRYGHDAQRGDPDSMLELYRTALATRRRLAFGAEPFVWVDAPGFVAFRRGHLLVATNLTAYAQRLPVALAGAQPVLESCAGALVGAEIAADSTVWFA